MLSLLFIVGLQSLFAYGAGFSVPLENPDSLELPSSTQTSATEPQLITATSLAETARLLFYEARHAKGRPKDSERLRLFERGVEAAEQSLLKAPENTAAIFWRTANLGAVAELKKNLGALKTLKELERVMLQFREVHPEFGFGGADRILGRMYESAPRFISIGSTQKAEESFLKAVKRYPDFPANRVVLAEFYMRHGKEEEAVRLMKQLRMSRQIETGNYGEFNIEKLEWRESIAKILDHKDVKSE